MEDFKPILIKDLNLSIGSTTVIRMAMNQHMPRVDRVREHSHPFDQWLLYLRGAGMQRIGERQLPIRRGSLIFLERNQTHSFEKRDNQNPLCLAVDIELPLRSEWAQEIAIHPSSLQVIEQCLKRLGDRCSRRSSLEFSIAAETCLILQQFEITKEGIDTGQQGFHTAKVSSWIVNTGLQQPITPSLVAKQMGLSVATLNQNLKREGITTVGALISSIRFNKAETLLRETKMTVSEIAESVGILDQNYFTRWFRKQCGQTPSEWRCNLIQK